MGEAVYAYDESTGLMKPADKTINAKGSTYTLTKAFDMVKMEQQHIR